MNAALASNSNAATATTQELLPSRKAAGWVRLRALRRCVALYRLVSPAAATAPAIHSPCPLEIGELLAYAGWCLDAEPGWKFPPKFDRQLELCNLHRAVEAASEEGTPANSTRPIKARFTGHLLLLVARAHVRLRLSALSKTTLLRPLSCLL